MGKSKSPRTKAPILDDIPRPLASSVMQAFYGGAARSEASSVRELALETIVTNPDQPRHIFAEEALEELKESIREFGLIQPIVVRSQKDRFEIVCGERRYRACLALGHGTIRAEVRELDNATAFKLALSENIHRDSLTPIEEAQAYRRLMESEALSQAGLARLLGVDRRRVSEKLLLLELPEEAQRALSARADIFTERHAVLLVHGGSHLDIPSLVQRTLEGGWSTRRLQEEIVRLEQRAAHSGEGGPMRLFENIRYLLNKRGGFTLTVRARSRQEVSRTLRELDSKLDDLRSSFQEESARADTAAGELD